MDSVNFALDDVAVEGTARFAPEDGGFSNAHKFSQTCLALLEKLRAHDPRVCLPQGGSVKEVYEALGAREPHFPLDAPDVEYRLLYMLCCHLQGERLKKHASRGDKRREEAAALGKTVFQLEKICNDLNMDMASVKNELDIIHAVRDKVSEKVSALPAGVLQAPPRVLPNIEQAQLTSAQILTLQGINEAFMADFLLRRQMLMKRLDVTIQSFLWGEKAQGKEGEARLATAEYYFAAGQEQQATQFALRARSMLDPNSIEWRRAVDIVLASGATPDDLLDLDRREAGRRPATLN